MAFTVETSLEGVAAQMAKYSTEAIKEAIKKKVREQAHLIIEQAAQEMAENVVASLDRFVEPLSGGIHLVLRVNNKEQKYESKV